MESKYIEFEIENGVLLSTWKSSFIDLEVAKEVINTRLQITKGKSYPLLINLSSVRDSTKEARDYLASDSACEGIAAGAICVNSSLENMLGNLFIFMSKPKVPTRVFKDKDKAKKWLSKFVDEN